MTGAATGCAEPRATGASADSAVCIPFDNHDARSVLVLQYRVEQPVIYSIHIDGNQSHVFGYLVFSKQSIERRVLSILFLTRDYDIGTSESRSAFFVQFLKRFEPFLIRLDEKSPRPSRRACQRVRITQVHALFFV